MMHIESKLIALICKFLYHLSELGVRWDEIRHFQDHPISRERFGIIHQKQAAG